MALPPPLPLDVVAGTGNAECIDGPCKTACFRGPNGIAISPAGELFVSDSDNRRLRKIFAAPPADAEGASVAPEPGKFDTVSTVAGGRGAGDLRLWDPCGVVVNAEGTAFVCDAGTHTIKRVTADGEISTFAGSGKQGCVDGVGNGASFSYPCARPSIRTRAQPKRRPARRTHGAHRAQVRHRARRGRHSLRRGLEQPPHSRGVGAGRSAHALRIRAAGPS
jgi:hypothetical protein